MACTSAELEKEGQRLQNLKNSLMIVQLKKEVREIGGDTGEADPPNKDKPAREARQPSTTSSSSETAQPKRKKRAKKRSPPPSAAVKMKEGQKWAESMKAEMIKTHQYYREAPKGTEWEPTINGHFDAQEVRKAARELKDFQRKKQQPTPPLPAGWKEHVDERSGDTFYHSKEEGATWDRPTLSDSHSSESEESEDAVKSGPDSPIRRSTPTTLTPRASPEGSQEPKAVQAKGAKGRGKGKKGGKAPRGAKTAICKYQHRRSGCQNGSNCRSVHDQTWKECYFWNTFGKCRKGDRCPMAHNQAEEKNETSPRTRWNWAAIFICAWALEI